jgi:hypothetical protein
MMVWLRQTLNSSRLACLAALFSATAGSQGRHQSSRQNSPTYVWFSNNGYSDQMAGEPHGITPAAR